MDERDAIIDDRQILLESEDDPTELGFNNFESIFTEEIPTKSIFELRTVAHEEAKAQQKSMNDQFLSKELFKNEYRNFSSKIF